MVAKIGEIISKSKGVKGYHWLKTRTAENITCRGSFSSRPKYAILTSP